MPKRDERPDLPDIDPIPRPLDHLVSLGFTNDVALTSHDQVLDYAALDQIVGRYAALLLADGAKNGDRVASWLPKTLSACVLPLAAARAGLIYVPINPLLKRAQVRHILNDSGATLFVTAQGRAELLEPEDIPADCNVLIEAKLYGRSLDHDPLPLSNQNSDDLAAILYTSGSTGKPKGVMLSHANLWLGAVSVAHYLKISRGDKVLCLLPLSFDYGQNQLLSTWAAGASAFPLDYLVPKDVIRAVERHDITTIAGVPPLWNQLVDKEWPPETADKVRRLTNSGGALSPQLIKALRTQFPRADIYPMYGLTEAFRSTWLDPTLVDLHPTSMGTAIPFAEVLVIKHDGLVAGVNEPGELVHAGPLVAKGYWRDPARTEERFKAAPTQSNFGGTAVWSGDTVYRDGNGLHFFIGREDEMIKVSGNRISPTEIESAALASNVVLEAVAFGVPDDRLGHSITLVVSGNDRDDAKLTAYLKSELPSFMLPTRVIWNENLPHNANGKLDRARVKSEATL